MKTMGLIVVVALAMAAAGATVALGATIVGDDNNNTLFATHRDRDAAAAFDEAAVLRPSLTIARQRAGEFLATLPGVARQELLRIRRS